ncbi:leucine-rich repeat domain-containing protein [Treponema phagedenis]|uniref:leucine-rich repeat domain-containing protein n=1 Tax=Treponema phagedenis TaxID=162 RepID=UPI0019804EFC|nr:leucine-rich repeat domain-containing protein [Treponema phagedenis]QSI00530.1 leucine-rich repeat domain-containing protein [Treponema phagedenis]
MMKNSSIVKKGLMQIHKSLLVAVLAFAALGILGGLTACKQSATSMGTLENGNVTVTITGENLKDIPTGGKNVVFNAGTTWKTVQKDLKSKITPQDNYEIETWSLEGKEIADSYQFKANATIVVKTRRKGTSPVPAGITVTVQGDANVKGVPFTLTATGKKWADIKAEAEAKITFTEGYELDSYRVSTKDGEYITDGYVFTKDTTIFVVSKEAGTPSTPTVTIHIKGDSNLILISDEMAVNKGKSWADIKADAEAKINFKEGYELAEWKLGDANGSKIEDSHVFTEETSVFVLAKKKGTTPAPTPLKNFITTETNGALTITGYDGELPAILEIPKKIDGKPVVGIGKDAFTEKTNIQKVIFPKSLKTIETGTWNSNSEKFEGAFSDCTNLTELDFSKCTELTSIGRGAFSGCSGITALTLPASITSIGHQAFYGCSGITALTLPASITSIGHQAFYGCSGITGSLTLPDSLTSIGDRAFSNCSGITGSLTLPDSLTAIGDWAFSGCSGITGSLTLPDSLTAIGDWAFSGCSGITGSLTLPDSLTSIGDWAFSNCSGITGSLTLPDSLTAIGSSAFYGCIGITSLALPASLISIGSSAFYGCIGITSLALPDSLTAIGHSAFSGCSGITALTLPKGLQTIGSGAFFGCTQAVITLPQSITKIDVKAFGDRDNTTSLCKAVRVPNSTIKQMVEDSQYTKNTDKNNPPYIEVYTP